MIRLAITGSTGRYPGDKNKLRPEFMEKMITVIREYIKNELNTTPDKVVLVSGGSAWAEHIAVQLYLTKEFAGLDLFLVSEFSVKQKKYVNTHEGRTLNQLLIECQDKTGIDVFSELAKSIDGKNKAKITIQRAFKPRNTLIAKNCDFLIAFTFGLQENVKGGAIDLWEKVSSDKRIHFDLSEL